MGKRSRKRQRERQPAGPGPDGGAPGQPAPRWGARLARVRLDDAEWDALHELAAARDIPVSELLGRIVRRSLAHRGLPRRTEATESVDAA